MYGGIEVRFPWADHDWYRGEPWRLVVDVKDVPLYTPYDGWDLLFGIHSGGDWEPIAARRGVPDDLSPELRALFTELRRDVLFAESWITVARSGPGWASAPFVQAGRARVTSAQQA